MAIIDNAKVTYKILASFEPRNSATSWPKTTVKTLHEAR